MRTIRGMLILVLGVAMLHAGMAMANTAQQAFDHGKVLLGQGDFSGALAAYGEAVRADRDNRQYTAQYSLVRQVVELRKRLDIEQDPARWEYMARALHSFYLSESVYPEALALGEKMHARLNTAATARTLAETQLALDKNAEAAKTLASLASDQATPSTQGLLVVALARQGKTDEARKIASSVVLSKEADARTRYGFAWMHAAAGDREKALAALSEAFEAFPPSLLPRFKEHARSCPEFAALPPAELAKAMATESKVAESKCSGGGNCAGCPNRGKCAQGEAQK